MFVSDFRKEFYEVVQSQVIPALGARGLVGEGLRGCGRGGREGPGFVYKRSANSLPPSPPVEGPSLRGLGRGRSVRLQDPSGEGCRPGRRAGDRAREGRDRARVGVRARGGGDRAKGGGNRARGGAGQGPPPGRELGLGRGLFPGGTVLGGLEEN